MNQKQFEVCTRRDNQDRRKSANSLFLQQRYFFRHIWFPLTFLSTLKMWKRIVIKTKIRRTIAITLVQTITMAFLLPVNADILYGVTHGTVNPDAIAPYGMSGQLISINTSTGAGTLIGQLDTVVLSGSVDTPLIALGIGTRGGNLYTYDEFPPQLELPALVIQVDKTTGHTVGSPIDPGNMRQFIEGDFAFRSSDGLGFISGANFGNPPSQLVSIDITVPSHTVVGSLSKHMDGLAFDSNNALYGINESDVNSGVVSLWTINPTTAVITLVGPLGVGSNENIAGLVFDSSGHLYAAINSGSSTPSYLYRLNKSTGAATLIGPIGFNDVSGLTDLTVAVAPSLTIARAGNQAIVSWDPSITGWSLQTNNNLDTGIWGNYLGQVVNNSATNSPAPGTMFFRLKQ